MIDYELGLAWTGPQGHLHLAAGYMVNHWFNAVTTPVFIDAVQANNYTDLGDTISFTGLVGRLVSPGDCGGLRISSAPFSISAT